MAINYNLSNESKAGRRLLAQVATARQWAEMKRNRRYKHDPLKDNKQPYKWGTLGLSAVSDSIKGLFHGNILSRRDRRAEAKGNYEFTAHYNGNGPIRTPHDIAPSKYARGRKHG